MKINAIGVDYTAQRAKSVKKSNSAAPAEEFKNVPRMTVISFRGGNKEQAIEWCAENKPYFQSGGVATAISDRRTLRVSDKDPIVTESMRKSIIENPLKSKAFAMPLYNASIVYDKETGLQKGIEVPVIPKGLPENSAFKQFEGKPCLINHPRFHDYASVEDFFKHEDTYNALTKKNNLSINGQVFILEDVTGGKRTMDFGGTLSHGGNGETEIKLYRTLWYNKDSKKFVPTSDFHILTDVTGSWSKPYEGGGYASSPGIFAQTWKGDGDARSAKAFVELTERICEVMSEKNGEKFDPATIVCNDSQASYSVEYMAEKAAGGSEFWKGKKPTVIGHNMGDGYIGKTSYMNMFVNVADKDLREAISKDPKYMEALIKGEDSVNRYFAELIPQEMKDSQGGVSAFRNALYYAEKGYVPAVTTVSEGYADKVVRDPSFAPATHSTLKELKNKDVFAGILNSMEDVGLSPYTKGIMGYYGSKDITDGFVVPAAGSYKETKLSLMQTFDPKLVNENSVDIKHVREIKRLNKVALLERLNQDTLKHLEALKDVKGYEHTLSTVVAGLPDKKVEVYGYIDKKYLEEVRKPNSDIKLLTAWGRGDTQKGLDTVLESFEKYVLGVGKNDKNTILVLGGDLKGASEEKTILETVNRLKDVPELKGRFAYLNGFAPNKPLASAADFAVFPSRFAPCELTDLESMKLFSSPIVTNCQGLAQKNFDTSFEGEAGKVTGYKTRLEYSTDKLEDLRNALPEKSSNKKILDREQLDKAIKKFRDDLSYKNTIKYGRALTDAEIDEKILKDSGLNYEYNFKVLRPFRDQVISDQLAECYERALITDRNKEVQTEMVKNHLKQYTDWERNGKLNKSGKSSAELYREYHFKRDGKAVNESDTLLNKLREQCKDAIARAKENGYKASGGSSKDNAGWWNKTKGWFKTNKKAAIITGSIAAAAGLGYAGYKAGILSPKFAEEKKNGHLSAVG